MKTKSRIFMASGIIACALLGGTAIAANTPTAEPISGTHSGKTKGPEIQVRLQQIANSETIRLIIDNSEGRRISVTLTDLSGDFISSTVAGKKEKEVVRDFNFEQADEGTYRLDIYDGHSELKKDIHLKRVHQKDITILNVQ
jgi:hypothetical protein